MHFEVVIDDSPLNLGQLLLSLELEDGNLAPRLELILLFTRRRVCLIDHACAQLDEAFHLALSRLATDGQRQRQRSELVDFILLRVARLTAAVEDVVELFAVCSVEYFGQAFCSGSIYG
jgi:hypothetical protein